jgi:parallel beta-helix repeat protein
MNLRSTRLSRFAPVAAAALIVAAGFAVAGPLNPPAGPVTSTMKTLAEVEPRIAINATNTPGNASFKFRITQPGSYYLTSNVEQASGGGIEIAAQNVTLDLNGFAVLSTSPTTGVGIQSNGGLAITVKNGTVSGWVGSGIVLGSFSTVRNVTVSAVNGSHGISVFSGVVESCVVQNGGAVGIQVSTDAIVRNCVVYGSDLHGIDAGSKCTIENCVSNLNGGHGINVVASKVTGCTTNNNQLSGVRSGGFSTFTDCHASQNTLDGFELATQDVITGCTADRNRRDGISALSRCRIEDNTCNENGFGNGTGAGILLRTSGSRNHVKNNTVVGNDWGVKVDSTLNLIAGNGASSNPSNFTIATGNRVTSIVNLATNAAPINGNTGGTSTLEADANYVY